MNTNQLLKALLRNRGAYLNLNHYTEILEDAQLVRLDLSSIENQDMMAEQFEGLVVKSEIAIPFDNLLFDLRKHRMANMITGEVADHNIGIHVMPVEFNLKDGNVLVAMLAIVYQMQGNDVTHRTYVFYADMGGLHAMADVDEGVSVAGCLCHQRNVFSAQPTLRNVIERNTPGYVGTTGYALPDCSAQGEHCAQTILFKKENMDMMRVILAYLMLPSNTFYTVEDLFESKKKRANRYTVVLDSAQVGRLIDSRDPGFELRGNSFIDGSRFSEAAHEAGDQPVGAFEACGRRYVTMAREAATPGLPQEA